MNHILEHDRAVLAFLNGLSGTSPLDQVMIVVSAHWPWVVILVCYLSFIFLQRNGRAFKTILWIAATIGITDMSTAYIMKPWFARLRPCRAESFVHAIDGCAGIYGFPSNHAANAACFAALWLYFYGKKQGYAALTVAAIVSISRVYLGVHYPIDIMAGFGYGALIACVSYWFCGVVWPELRSKEQ